MPALPWITREEIEPDREYVVMASSLPLRRHRSVPAFLRDTMAIRTQLARTDGLVAYGLKADLLHKRFWTYSVWRDEQSLRAFAASEPHRTIMTKLRPHMGATKFVTTL